MTANSLYSNFIDAADDNGNIKKDRGWLNMISTLAGGIVRYDLYNELNAGGCWPMFGGTAFSHKFNFMNPVDSDAAYRLTFPNGMTHTELGMQGNGTNQYATTNFLPPNSFYTNSHLSIYSTSNQQLNDSRDIGVNGTNFSIQLCIIRGFNNQGFCYIGSYDAASSVGSSISSYDARGFYLGNRNSTSSLSFNRNGIKLAENINTYTPVGSPSSLYRVLIGATNANGTPTTFSNRRYGHASIGLGFTESKSNKYSHLVRTIQGIKSRQ